MSASTPRILQSADEAPCGSLWQTIDGGDLVLRMMNGNGWNLHGALPRDVGWPWDMADDANDFPARLIAEGLTESECRHLSGLSAADAIAWCEARDKAAKAAPLAAALAEREDAFVRRGYMLDNLRASLAAAHKERDEARNARDSCYARREEAARIAQTYVADALDGQRKAKDETLATVKERDEARAGWAEQTADAARLRIALQEAQRRLVQAHEDIDTLITKQTAVDFEIAALKQDRTWAQEGRQTMHILACGNELLAQHHARIVGRLLDEMARGYFVDRFLDPNLYADAMKAAGREVKP